MGKKAEERPMPHSRDAESCVLGSALIDNKKIPEIMQVLEGAGDPFYAGNNQTIWESIVSLYASGANADLITVSDDLRGFVSVSEISKLVDGIPDLAATLSYARIVRENAFARMSIRIMEKASDAAFLRNKPDVASLMEVVGKWENDPSSEECYNADELAKQAAYDYDNFSYEDVTIKTGFPTFDAYTMGLQRGTLAILAARPGAGKTAIALNIAYNVARWENRRVLFFSLEMPTRLMHDRLVSSIGQIPLRAIKNRGLNEFQMERYLAALADLRGIGDNLVLDMASYELNSIIGRALGEHARKKVDLVIIDFAQKIVNSSGPEQRHLNLEHTVYSLVNMAKKMDANVLLLSQLNRGAFDEPDLKQLAESSGLERGPRMAAILAGQSNTTDCIRKLHLLKNSEGETGVIDMHFNGGTMTFEDGGCRSGCPNYVDPSEAMIQAIIEKGQAVANGTYVPLKDQTTPNPAFMQAVFAGPEALDEYFGNKPFGEGGRG